MNGNRRAVYASILRRAHELHRMTLAVAGTSGAWGAADALADDPCRAVESEIDRLIAEQEAEELVAIEKALLVLKQAPELYGRCEVCAQEIAARRLTITPWTTRCDTHDLEHSFRD